MKDGTRNVVSYAMVGHPVEGGGMKTVVRASCHKCGGHDEISAPASGHNPEGIAKLFRLRGWEFDAYHKNRCKCPSCVAERAARTSDPDELLTRKAAMMSVTPIKPTVASDDATANARELAPKELRAAMAMLEQHFDDKAGVYMKGWNDRRLSEELNLPMACVTRVRRDAFGELKSTVEIEAIRREFQDLFSRVVDLEARINKLAEGSS